METNVVILQCVTTMLSVQVCSYNSESRHWGTKQRQTALRDTKTVSKQRTTSDTQRQPIQTLKQMQPL